MFAGSLTLNYTGMRAVQQAIDATLISSSCLRFKVIFALWLLTRIPLTIILWASIRMGRVSRATHLDLAPSVP